jgi:hypothetical protein
MGLQYQRKVISGLVLLTIGVTITFIKGDIPDNLKDLMEWLYFAFVLGNGLEYFSNLKLGNIDVKYKKDDDKKDK